jgi:hypothetical protein
MWRRRGRVESSGRKRGMESAEIWVFVRPAPTVPCTLPLGLRRGVDLPRQWRNALVPVQAATQPPQRMSGRQFLRWGPPSHLESVMQRRSSRRLASHVKTLFLVAVHLTLGTRVVVGRRALNHGLGASHASMLVDVWHVNVNINTAGLDLCSTLVSRDHPFNMQTCNV